MWFASRVKRFCLWVFNLPKRFWRWGLRLPKKISIPLGIIMIVGISFGTYHLVMFWDYMQNNPEFCNSCHIMDESWDRWETSEHAEVGCHSCHHQSLLDNARQLYDFIFKSYDETEGHAEVKEDSCMVCHESGDPNWIQVANTSGHKLHNEIQDIECVVCHSTTVHRFAPTADTCLSCHTDQRVTMVGMDDVHCHVCHDFVVESDQLLPERAACLNCHEASAMDVTWSADAPMQYPCGDCHLPHEQTHVIVDCTLCHTVGGYHFIGSHSVMSCETCHEAHIWNTEERDTCLTCHPGQVEHQALSPCNTCHTFSAH